MPESVKNRPTTATEEVFLFAKAPTYFYDSTAVRETTGANLRNFWVLGPEPNGNGYPASFPSELARRCILLGSRVGDTVLDPFGGSGTTGIAALELGRNAILIELNPSYVKISKERPKWHASPVRSNSYLSVSSLEQCHAQSMRSWRLTSITTLMLVTIGLLIMPGKELHDYF